VSASSVWQVGSWSDIKNRHGNGVQWSFDGGKTFVGANWNQNITARYGSFLDIQNGWIAGGEFPSSDSLTEGQRVHHFSQHLSFVDGIPKLRELPSKSEAPIEGYYSAGISSTNDGGSTWTTLYQNNGTKRHGFYFNGIAFTDESNGWVAGEGQDANSTYGFIWGTNDGGSTWEQQLYIESASIIQIRMVDASNGWACGGLNVGSGLMKGAFWKTSNGQNWTLDDSLLGNYQLNLGVIDIDTAYSVGINILSESSVSRYFPL